MIISRTPYRISFLGGGTDYPAWYQEHGAAVLATTINHYCYLQCRLLPPFFKHHSRIVWSQIEEVLQNNDINHPSVKMVLDFMRIPHGVEIHHQGDLPARSGLGSSSAFTVGLLNALYGLQGAMASKRELAMQAIHVERDLLRENVGVQDQIQTAFGGFNHTLITPDGEFRVQPVVVPESRLLELNDHLLLFFTGVARTASEVAGDQIKSIPNRQAELKGVRELVDVGLDALTKSNDICDFGRILHESWLLKQRISTKIAPSYVTDIYNKAMAAGAIGGKLLGAGGGGFMLFFVKPELQANVCTALANLLHVPFQFERHGTQIIYYENNYQQLIPRKSYRHLVSNNSLSPEEVVEE